MPSLYPVTADLWFFPGLEGKHSLHDPLIMFAAVEAVVGLIIEISVIATFTQRFFGK